MTLKTSNMTEGSSWTLRKFVLTLGSCICIVRWVNIDLATFFRSCRCLCAVQWVRWLKCVFLFFFFFKMTIIRVIFSCLYCWTIKIWLLIFLATGKSGVLFQGRYFFEAKSIFWGNVCFWSNRLLSIRNTLSFLIVGGPPACHVFEFCIQVMLSIAVESASIIWNVTPIASTMTTKAEFIGGLTVLRCFIYQCLNI